MMIVKSGSVEVWACAPHASRATTASRNNVIEHRFRFSDIDPSPLHPPRHTYASTWEREVPFRFLSVFLVLQLGRMWAVHSNELPVATKMERVLGSPAKSLPRTAFALLLI